MEENKKFKKIFGDFFSCLFLAMWKKLKFKIKSKKFILKKFKKNPNPPPLEAHRAPLTAERRPQIPERGWAEARIQRWAPPTVNKD